MKKMGHWLIWAAVLTLTALLGASPGLAAGKVIVYSSNQQQQNDMMAAAFEKATNEAGWKKVEKFLKNALITEQSANVYTSVANGEVPAGITMEYAAYRYKVGGAAIEVVNPAEGTVASLNSCAVRPGKAWILAASSRG